MVEEILNITIPIVCAIVTSTLGQFIYFHRTKKIGNIEELKKQLLSFQEICIAGLGESAKESILNPNKFVDIYYKAQILNTRWNSLIMTSSVFREFSFREDSGSYKVEKVKYINKKQKINLIENINLMDLFLGEFINNIERNEKDYTVHKLNKFYGIVAAQTNIIQLCFSNIESIQKSGIDKKKPFEIFKK